MDKNENQGDASQPEDKDKEEKPATGPKVGYFSLYRFANSTDVIMIVIAWISAIIVGAAQPAMMIIFGRTIDDFTAAGKFSFCDTNSTQQNDDLCAFSLQFISSADSDMIKNKDEHDPNEIMEKMTGEVYWFIGFALVTWLFGYIQTACLMVSAERQTTRIRSAYFRAIVRQDIGYFDTHDAGELNTRMFDDVKKIKDGISEKVGIAVQSAASFFVGMGIGFFYGWKLACVVIGVSPLLAISGYFMMYATTEYGKGKLDAYAAAGGIAEEVISGIRTVTAFTGQNEEVARYKNHLKDAEKAGIKKSCLIGASMGFVYFTMFLAYALAFWYGAKLIVEDEYTPGDKLIVFFSVIIGAFGISMGGQNAEHMMAAQVAAFSIFEIIDRVPPIDTESDEGKMLDDINGVVEFKNVHFTYPSRTDQEVLSGVSFQIEQGKTTALCGQSGCGKSTCFQLIKRFYDTAQGSVIINGMDIKDINIKSLRSLIGVVSQEPVLFDLTIEENIRMGRLDVTKQDIENAAKQANAYDFITKLPNAWDTLVGEGGATLSGGQKQRVAIARALVRNPKILLLDEATSALDTESEAIVQKALENASKGRTTIVIAHRLSTIRNSDKIVGFKDGKVTEEGTHDELMKIDNGVYFNLCNMQSFDKDISYESTAREITKKESLKELEKKKSDAELKEEEEKDSYNVSYGKILKMNRAEWPLMIVGTILSMGTGAIQIVWALLFGDVLGLYGKYNCAINKDMQNATAEFESVLYNKTFDPIDIRASSPFCDQTEFYGEVVHLSVMFVLLGAANFVGFFGSIYLFGVSGEKLTTRIRKRCFQKLLRFEMGFFDDPMNSTGALTSRLASDASKVQGATGGQINAHVQSTGAMIFGLAVAFYYSWMLTLVCFAFVPFIIITTSIQMSIFTDGVQKDQQKALEDASKIATEATINIRTVADLGREEKFAGMYKQNIKNTLEGETKKINVYGFMYGASLGLPFIMQGVLFYFASWMIARNHMDSSDFQDILKVLFAIMFAAMTSGQASAMAPNYGEAINGANRIFKLLECESQIDPENEGGKKPDKCSGEITFKDVTFHYPTRPDVKVLKGLDLTVKPGETLALVGQTGCGKSTCIQLLERFYDGTAGNITLDNERLCDLNLKWLRQQIGFVQQEPILFNKTIQENILYGLEATDGHKMVSKDKNKVGVQHNAQTEEDMKTAAIEANALQFIQDLPDKFNTNCGKKGSQLSGGQKQRIAIARALVRHPKILLLDEATSALDAESEKLVQNALNNARKGRTCILIAHRLSTVINADKIAVIDNGVVSEIGTHTELINKKGAYYSLVNSQL